MKKNALINKLARQLAYNNPEKIIEVDVFSDNSAAWIEIKPKNIDLKKGYSIVEVLTFDGEGKQLMEVNCYKNIYTVTEESEKIK